MLKNVRWLACGLTTVALAFPAASNADQLFKTDGYRNKPLPAGTATDPMSALWVADIARKASQGVHANVDDFGVSIYTVPDGLTGKDVNVLNKDHPNDPTCANDGGSPCLAAQWQGVPLPDGAQASKGSDGEMAIWQPSTDTMWEFYKYRLVNGKPTAEYGGRLQDVKDNPGVFPETPGKQFGAAASKIPLLAGVPRIGELQAGSVEHVVSFAIRAPDRAHRAPANGSDGALTLGLTAPEGACFRLPASLNLNTLGLTPYGLTIARAVQRYGLVLTDAIHSDNMDLDPGVVISGEWPNDGSRPYYGENGIFRGRDNSGGSNGVLQNFPWSRLQALTSKACTTR